MPDTTITLQIPALDRICELLEQHLGLDTADDAAPGAAGEAPKPRRGRKSNAEKAAAAAAPAPAAVAFGAPPPPPAAAVVPDVFGAAPAAPAAEPPADAASVERLRAVIGPIVQCDSPAFPVRSRIMGIIAALQGVDPNGTPGPEMPKLPKSKHDSLLQQAVLAVRELQIPTADLQKFEPAILDKLGALKAELGSKW